MKNKLLYMVFIVVGSVVAAEKKGEPINNAPHEHSKIEWLDTDNLPDNIMDYQKSALENIKKGDSYGEFGFN